MENPEKEAGQNEVPIQEEGLNLNNAQQNNQQSEQAEEEQIFLNEVDSELDTAFLTINIDENLSSLSETHNFDVLDEVTWKFCQTPVKNKLKHFL